MTAYKCSRCSKALGAGSVVYARRLAGTQDMYCEKCARELTYKEQVAHGIAYTVPEKEWGDGK